MDDGMSYERYLTDERFRAALHAAAHRARAEAVHRLLVRPLLARPLGTLLRRASRVVRRPMAAAPCRMTRFRLPIAKLPASRT